MYYLILNYDADRLIRTMKAIERSPGWISSRPVTHLLMMAVYENQFGDTIRFFKTLPHLVFESKDENHRTATLVDRLVEISGGTPFKIDESMFREVGLN